MKESINRKRRQLLQVASSLPLISFAPFLAAAEDRQIVVADGGGPYSKAFRKAFYDPFEEATGVKVHDVARPAQPSAQFAAMVQTGNYIWDVCMLALSGDVPYLESKGFLQPLGFNSTVLPDLMQSAVTPNWLGIDVYSTILAFRKDKFGTNGPSSWADFWDIKRYPGIRSMRRSPIDTLEQALLSDGVPLSSLYPLNVERAFKRLDQIKAHVGIWWTSGAQATQAIQNGDVDMIATYNGRAQSAIEAGAPVTIVWNQGLYSIEGWGIPKGAPRAELGKQFIKFCADAKRQAVMTESLAYGPTNRKAFDSISAQRTVLLPTAPVNIRNMGLSSATWWNENRVAVTERFNSWIIS
jgi:putative spermidine/putrescine transport system substrate-binding protein